MAIRTSGGAEPRCPACGRSAGVAPVGEPRPGSRRAASGRPRPPARAAIRAAAERVASARLGARPDTHPFNYAVAALGMTLVCVAIPGTAWDFVRSGLYEIGLLGLAVAVNATLLRERSSAIGEYDRRRRRLVERVSASIVARCAASWYCPACRCVFAPPSAATAPLGSAESYFLEGAPSRQG